MKTVVIYTTGFCPYCIRAKFLLNSKGVDYMEIRVDREPDKRREMVEKAKGFYTVPQIFIDEEHIGGCDELYVLEKQQKLDSLLQN